MATPSNLDRASAARQAALAGFLKSLQKFKTDVEALIGTADNLDAFVLGLDLAEHAALAVAIDEARKAADFGKRALTSARTNHDKWFSAKIAKATGSMKYKTETHTFSVSQRCFARAPSQVKHPEAFKAVLDWLRANDEGDRIEATQDGLYSLDAAPAPPTREGPDDVVEERPRDFSALCERLLEDGKKLPPGVPEPYMEDAVAIRVRRGSQATLDSD